MKNIDEAIQHCLEVAEGQEQLAENYDEWDEWEKYEMGRCQECASEHRQLAEWLKELKKYRAIFEKIGMLLCEYGYTMDDLDTIYGKVDEEVNTNDNT